MEIDKTTIAALEADFGKEVACEVDGHGTVEDANIHDTGGAKWKVTSHCAKCPGDGLAHVLMCDRAHMLVLITVGQGKVSLRCGAGHETPIREAYVKSTPWG
jgi:hypothetical protein